ncbi:MAG TPA: DNA primase DnaG [Candidatus Nanoarchaeia archaeon]|nr:DNA primase DnaG [Candidatus Nanoarchaeia archaeon]
MGKISPVSSKYIVNATIEIEGVVDRPDVIGAIFGQTEGLLGEELELRELQRSGRIGRIEVNIDTKGGKSIGQIIIPSSLDKAETAIVAAALEVIQRIGPCNAKVRVQNIEDVRISKRTFVVERAKQLLRNLMDNVMPDSQEIAEEVAHSIRVMEITEYGKDRLPAGPEIESSEEVIVVEGRADVMNLLKHGFKNCIAMNGTSVPQTVIELSHRKDLVVFVDGDRGGNLILRDLFNVAEVDFVTRAPDGKEVEELAKKEIHKALRSRITVEQAKLELGNVDTSQAIRKPMMRTNAPMLQGQGQQQPLRQGMPQRPMQATPTRTRPILRDEERKALGGMLEGLVGTKGAYVLDEKMNVLGKVPLSELNSTLRTLNTGVYAVVLDGSIDRDLVDVAETSTLKHIVGMDTKVKSADSRLNIVTAAEL